MKILISNHLNRYFRAVSLSAVLLLLFVSCSGGPDNGNMPEWLSSYPASNSFYVGIGGSNTGNLAEDREKAAAAARADLAAQISAHVSSDLKVSSQVLADGSFTEKVDRTVNQSVEQNLKSVETVDTWFSPEHGSWVFVRLSKAGLGAIVNEEISDLTLRANTILKPFVHDSLTEAEKMAVLGRSRNTLLSSPWGLRVKDEVLGSDGFLIDSVDAQISERTGSLKVTAQVNPPSVKYGSEIVVSGVVESGSGGEMGAYPLVLTSLEIGSKSIITNPEGLFSITLAPETSTAGTFRLEIMPDLTVWEIPPGGFPLSREVLEFSVEPIRLALQVDSSAVEELFSFDGAVGDWISGLNLPVETVSSRGSDFDLEFAWTVFDFPRSEKLANAPYITQVGAVLTISRGGNTVLVREIDPFKDGGLDWEQAHKRAARNLLKQITEDPFLPGELAEAFRL
jgi:hypothetical protein